MPRSLVAGVLLLLQRLGRVGARHTQGLKVNRCKDHDDNNSKSSSVDDRGVVSADDISFEPASDDCISNRNRDSGGNHDRKHEAKSDIPDELFL